ncbi:peptidylprolyl isomerase [Microbulbifer sp. CAU 1566]|uniref:peptidylprolyl isomerase n=1 Tax=Microbulbifer sp. CAU 1566 TaxID=2933269 RepID=UPI002006021C|nr:peptidylprolyl isomerase [Microbulbifer sp. CAU 1566]MCK7598441.1 peptidylprolyl isomerase [Microbulbifer sp. CAU 1566]
MLHWIKDPSAQFALIGALLFAINSAFQGDQAADTEDIIVSEARIQHLAGIFERGWQRPPEPAELQGLIDDFVREEVLYREAVKMGLDRDDTVIRRRLRMKMELLARDLVNAIEPAEQVLRDYHQRHIQKYTQPAQYSFEQIFLNSDQRPQVAEDARMVLTKLTAGGNPRKLGDNSLLQFEMESASVERIDRQFGADFSQQLLELPDNEWSGPLTSAYGEHLVKISARQPRRETEFSEVRAEVLRDWQQQEQNKILQTQYETLRDNYRIQISAASTTAMSSEASR